MTLIQGKESTGERFMTTKSLHQIMNEIAARIDVLEPIHASGQDDLGHFKPTAKQQQSLRGNKDPLSEIDAFMQMDDLLAHLHKEYLEAKIHRQQLLAQNGKGDPMAEIAMDMEDSAYCAFQTRYIELRQIGELMAKVQRLMRESMETIEREKNKEREKEFRNFILLSKMQEKNRQENNQGGFEYAILLLIFNLVPSPKQQSYMPQQGIKMAA